MTIERKKLFAMLASGGAIAASRIMPFPHRYTLTLGERVEEIGEETARELVDEKYIAGKPQDELWDRVAFTVISPFGVRTMALEYYECGFGRCAVCGEFPLGAGANALAPRHGADKEHNIPPCAGTGKPLTALILPDRTSIVTDHAA